MKLNWRTKRGVFAAKEDPRKKAESDRRARIRLISNLSHDEAFRHYSDLWKRIKIGLLVYYVWTLGGLYMEFSWGYVLWVLVLIPALGAVAYFIGGAIHHPSNKYPRKSEQQKRRDYPRTGRVVSVREQIERSRRLRAAFHQMHFPDTPREEPVR